MHGAPQVGVSGVGGGGASRGGDVTASMPRMAVRATPLAKLGSRFTFRPPKNFGDLGDFQKMVSLVRCGFWMGGWVFVVDLYEGLGNFLELVSKYSRIAWASSVAWLRDFTVIS